MAIRKPMSRENRAKQFMPFSALKGYEEALLEKEKIVVEKIQLSEDMKQELDEKFSRIKINKIIRIIYFKNGEYIEKTGMVSKLCVDDRYIRIVNENIPLDDIYKVDII